MIDFLEPDFIEPNPVEPDPVDSLDRNWPAPPEPDGPGWWFNPDELLTDFGAAPLEDAERWRL